MELPKNITQIGESNRNCKIYVEDYVISYIKQMNRLALNKEMAVALYGVRKNEGDVTYLFLYGAGKLDFIQREVRHLSQAQSQEVEKVRKRYFEEYQFQGYCLLNGEMVEGFHVSEQGICRYITGYAQFYEKNDSMLAYMLDMREQEVSPEVVNQEKYDMVRKRQEERRAQQGDDSMRSRERKTEQATRVEEHADRQLASNIVPLRPRNMNGLKLATVAVFALLCLLGLSTLGGNGTKDFREAARQVMNSLTEQKLPDAEAAMNEKVQSVQTNTLIAEDKLTEALQQENSALTPTPTPVPVATPEPASTPEPTPTPASSPEPVAEPAVAPTPESYTIRQGDTLIGISVNRYGSDSRVADICSMNQIADPNDIKIGQKILLP